MRITRQFAEQRGAPVNRSRASAAAFSAPGNALSRQAEQVGGQVEFAIDKKMRRDAAVIVANTLATVQEKAEKGYLDAQSKTQSTITSVSETQKLKTLDSVIPDQDGNNVKFADYIANNFDEAQKAVLDGISNPYAKQALQEQLPRIRENYVSRAAAYEARASLEYRKELLTDAADKFNMLTFNNPAQFLEYRNQLLQYIDDSGIPSADIQAQKRELANGLAYNSMLGMISQNTAAAEQVLSDQSSALRNELNPSQISNLQSRIETKKNTDNTLIRQQVSRQLPDHKQSLLVTGKGIPGFEESVRLAYPNDPARADAILQEAEAYKMANTHISELNGKPLGQLTEYLDTIKPEAGDENFKVKDQMHGILQSLAAEQANLAKKDPVAMVQQAFPEEFDQINETDNPREFAEKALALQRVKGVPDASLKVMSKSKREAIISAIEREDPNNVVALLQSFMQEYDQVSLEDQPMSKVFLNELISDKDGLSPTYKFVAANLSENRQRVAYDLVRATARSKDLKTVLDSEDKKDQLSEYIDRNLNEYFEALLEGDANALPFVLDTKEAARNLSLLYLVESPDVQGNMKKAVQKAANLLVNDRIADISGSLILPTVMYEGDREVAITPNRVKAGLSSLIGDYTDGKPSLPISEELTFRGAEYLAETDPKLKNELIGIALRDGYWKTVGDFSSAMLMLPIAPDGGYLPAKDKDGGIMLINFLDAQKYLEGSPPIKELGYEGSEF